jgi:ATP-binding cassette, subfamily G (WHITE), member 2
MARAPQPPAALTNQAIAAFHPHVQGLQVDTMQMSKEAQDELNVKRSTATPLWKGLATMIKYRTTHNYKDGEFIGARLGDKFIFALLIGTLYLGIGDDLKPENLINISAVLFMWSTLPAYAPAIP